MIYSAHLPGHRNAGRTLCSRAKHRAALLIVSLFAAGLAMGATVPPPEQLLPEETLILLTTPDFSRLRQASQSTPRGRLWADPAMKPLKEKFLSRLQEELVKPLERELNLSLASYASLPQGQLTFAVTRNANRDSNKRGLGFLLLLDTRDKRGLLATNLAELRRKWVAGGRTLKTEKIRNVELAVFPITTNDVPKTLSKYLWRQPVFAPVSGGTDMKQAPVTASKNRDLLLDALSVLLTTSKELVVCQVDSLLVVGNSVTGLEPVIVRLTGGAAPTLGGLAAYQPSQTQRFPDAAFYGWVNIKAFTDALARTSSESDSSETTDPFETLKPDKLAAATGLASCKTVSFTLRSSDEGSIFQAFLNAPEASREGLFAIVAGAAKEAAPPPFVPADAVEFLRWRLDCPKACSGLGKILGALSPQALSAINLILDTANARAKENDPAFDLRKTLLTNLGDDLISYSRAPRGHTMAELLSPPSLFLLGSPNPEQLAVALKRLFVIFPQGDAPAEREFLGRKIFSVPLPSLPFLLSEAPRPTAPRNLSCAASGGYVALSTDVALLEEFLRSSESQAKALREKPGLLEAAQKVGGMGTGLFAYANEAESMRVAFEAAKLDTRSSTNGIGPDLFPGLPGITGPESGLNDWVDFSLLPAFDRVSAYFHSTVWTVGANVDGLTLKIFAPVPPALRATSSSKPIANQQ